MSSTANSRKRKQRPNNADTKDHTIIDDTTHSNLSSPPSAVAPPRPRGYQILPLRLSDDETESAARYVYYKPYSNGSDSQATSLHVVNVPFTFDANAVSTLFAVFGDIADVKLNAPTTDSQSPYDIAQSIFCDLSASSSPYYRSAIVTFSSTDSVKTAINTDLSTTPQAYIAPPTALGLSAWLSQYENAHPDVAALKTSIDTFMSAFDQRKSSERTQRQRAPATDSDGFTIVRYKRSSRTQNDTNNTLSASTTRKKLKAKDSAAAIGLSFYRSSRLDNAAKRMESLQAKFEADKAKIAQMKANRTFKPF